MNDLLNAKIKRRESFRPFAPPILREDLPEWFDMDAESPHMLFIAPVIESKRRTMSAAEQALFGIEKLNVARSTISAVTHVDYSARIQTVHPETNALFHALLKNFKGRTGCPILVNTSFNVPGEPIVCPPRTPSAASWVRAWSASRSATTTSKRKRRTRRLRFPVQWRSRRTEHIMLA